MNRTKIEWAKNSDGSPGFTWNPITGCHGMCPYCYARRYAHRFHRSFQPAFHKDRLAEPIKRKIPSTIFVSSNADLLGEWISKDWIEQVITVMRATPNHRYLLLTKNPVRYQSFDWPTNSWLGATAVTGGWWTVAIAAFHRLRRSVPISRLFISCEPLLDIIIPLSEDLPFIDWLIVGAETTPRPKQIPRKWISQLAKWARSNHIPVFLKNNLRPSWPHKLTQQIPWRLSPDIAHRRPPKAGEVGSAFNPPHPVNPVNPVQKGSSVQ